MKDFQKEMQNFREMQANRRPAEDVKMVIVVVMVVSVVIFSIVGDDKVRPYIWIWVVLMSLAVVLAAVLDIIAWRKNKALKELNDE